MGPPTLRMRQGSRPAITSDASVPMEIALPPTPILIECGHTDRGAPPQPRGGSARRTHASGTVYLLDKMVGQPGTHDRNAVLLHLGPVHPERRGEVVKDVGQLTGAIEALPQEPGRGIEHIAVGGADTVDDDLVGD